MQQPKQLKQYPATDGMQLPAIASYSCHGPPQQVLPWALLRYRHCQAALVVADVM